MKFFNIQDETYLGIRGISINVFNKELFNSSSTKGFYRFRILGYGLVFKDLTEYPRTVNELSKKDAIRYKRWYIRFLKI